MSSTEFHSQAVLEDWGNWGEHTSWEFWRSRNFTAEQRQLTRAVACVAIYDLTTPSVVLTRSARGTEILGGHVDEGETIEQARDREALEEGGYYVAHAALFGYRKFVNHQTLSMEGDGRHYPPLGYSPFYYTFTDRELSEPTGEETLEHGVYTVPEIEALTLSGAIKLGEFTIIKAGLAAAHQDAHYGN